jgi:hypothetical protein
LQLSLANDKTHLPGGAGKRFGNGTKCHYTASVVDVNFQLSFHCCVATVQATNIAATVSPHCAFATTFAAVPVKAVYRSAPLPAMHESSFGSAVPSNRLEASVMTPWDNEQDALLEFLAGSVGC